MVDLDAYVCGTCGVPVVRRADNTVLHIDSIPEDIEVHDAFPWVTRREYLLRQDTRRADTPGERSAIALERVADALEAIVARLDT